METIVVGGGLLLLALVPVGLLADVPGGSDMQTAVIDRSTAWSLTYAFHRLLFGLLIHTTHTALVVRFVRLGTSRWLMAAMRLHAANNALAWAVQERLSEPSLLALFSLGLLATYGAILAGLWRLKPIPPASAEGTDERPTP